MNAICTCPECGIEVIEDVAICPHCNAVIGPATKAEIAEHRVPELDENSGRDVEQTIEG